MMPFCLYRTERGFGLVELLVAMVLGLVVIWAVLKVFVHQNRTNAAQQEVAYAQQNVRAGVDLMAREIRSAGYYTTESGLTPIPIATSTSIQVRSDLNSDGDTGDTGEDVTYSEVTDSNGTYLARNGTNIVYDVVPGSLQCTYYGSGSTASFVPATQEDRDDIRVVAIQIQVRTENADFDTGQFRIRTLATRVRIRNMGFGDIE